MPQRNETEYNSQRRSVWELRSRGVSGYQIASDLDIPVRTVYRWIKEMAGEAASELQEVAVAHLVTELERLDRWQTELEAQLDRYSAMNKSISATVTELIRVSERRAKLLDLDAATKVQHTVTELTQDDIAFAELLSEERARAANAQQSVMEDN